MNNKITLLLIAFLGVSGFQSVKAQSLNKNKKPNIVLILADDLGYGDLSCYGATKVNTPNIDKIALNGMRFTDAHSPSAVCSPTRYGVLTGRYCWRTPLKRGPLPKTAGLWFQKDRVTLPSMLQQEGYVTGGFGKWHLGVGAPRQKFNYKTPQDWNKTLVDTPNDMGFDYFYGIPGGHNMAPHINIENHEVVGVEKGLKVTDQYRFNDGASHKVGPDEILGLETYNRYDPHQLALNHTRKAIEFIEKNHEQPFFMYVPTINVHLPHTPHEVFKKTSKVGDYGDFLNELDWEVGQIYKKLEEKGVLDNTIFIFTSDNGATKRPSLAYGHKSNGDLRGQKGDIYEGGHRVPCIISWPQKIASNTTTNQLFSLTDIMPTIASLMDLKLAKNSSEDGYDFSKVLLKSKRKPVREAIVNHSASGAFAIRKGFWKLCLTNGSGGLIKKERIIANPENSPKWQLFNLETDLAEKNNLYNKYPEKVKELKELLDSFKEKGASNF